MKKHTLIYGLLSIATVLRGLALYQQPLTTYAASLDCSTASNINIPVLECEALLDLYDSTNGGSWRNQTNWDTDTDICTWYGIECTNIAGQDRVTSLSLQSNNLQGTLPASLSILDQLQDFTVSSNQIGGELPPAYSNWTNIEHFSVNENANGKDNPLNGILPPEYGDWTNIQTFNIMGTQINGILPPEYGNWINIETFNIRGTRINGILPPEYGDWINIETFNIRNTQINGILPPEYGDWTNIQTFDIRNAQINGILPPEYGNWVNIKYFGGNANQIGGELPPEYGNWVNIEEFTITENQITGELPPEYGNWANIERFNIRDNQIGGELPPAYSNWTNIKYFYITDNQIGGELPPAYSNWINIELFEATRNQIGGELPPAYSNWINLKSFAALNNNLIGSIPDERAIHFPNNGNPAFDLACNNIQSQGYIFPTSIWIESNVRILPNNCIPTENNAIIVGTKTAIVGPGTPGYQVIIYANNQIYTGTIYGLGIFEIEVMLEVGINNIQINIIDSKNTILEAIYLNITSIGEEEVTPFRDGGRGGGLKKDDCPDGDYSPSYYDGTCGEKPIVTTGGQIQTTGGQIQTTGDQIQTTGQQTQTEVKENIGVYGVSPDRSLYCRYDDGAFSNYVFGDMVGTRYDANIQHLLDNCLVHGYKNAGQEFGIYNETKLGEVYKVFARMSMLDFRGAKGSHRSDRYKQVGEKAGLWKGIDTTRDPELSATQADLYQVALNYLAYRGVIKDAPPIYTTTKNTIIRGSFANFIAMLLKITK